MVDKKKGPSPRRPLNRFSPDRLEALRTMRDMTKSAFTRKADLTRQGYDDILSGAIKPNVSTLERIAQVFGVDCSFFFVNGVHQNDKHR